MHEREAAAEDGNTTKILLQLPSNYQWSASLSAGNSWKMRQEFLHVFCYSALHTVTTQTLEPSVMSHRDPISLPLTVNLLPNFWRIWTERPWQTLEFSLEIRAKHVDIEDIDRRRGRVLHKIRSMNLHQQWPCWGSPSHQQPCSKNQQNPTFKLFFFFDLQPVEFLRFTVIIVYM